MEAGGAEVGADRLGVGSGKAEVDAIGSRGVVDGPASVSGGS